MTLGLSILLALDHIPFPTSHRRQWLLCAGRLQQSERASWTKWGFVLSVDLDEEPGGRWAVHHGQRTGVEEQCAEKDSERAAWSPSEKASHQRPGVLGPPALQPRTCQLPFCDFALRFFHCSPKTPVQPISSSPALPWLPLKEMQSLWLHPDPESESKSQQSGYRLTCQGVLTMLEFKNP